MKTGLIITFKTALTLCVVVALKLNQIPIFYFSFYKMNETIIDWLFSLWPTKKIRGTITWGNFDQFWKFFFNSDLLFLAKSLQPRSVWHFSKFLWGFKSFYKPVSRQNPEKQNIITDQSYPANGVTLNGNQFYPMGLSKLPQTH